MSKTPSTINLEEMFWDMIKEYQKDNNISSRNDAIQFILHEWSILRGSNVKTTNIPVNKPIEVKKEEKKVDPKIANGLLKIKGSMKE